MSYVEIAVSVVASVFFIFSCWFGIKEYIASKVDLGKAQNQADATKETNVRMNEDVKTAKDVQHQVDILTGPDVHNKLFSRWRRKL